ncbi:Maf family protein [Rickettsiales endosymbiont of Trichoplax sp. H2]|uniref:Maf family protein n=1 Tax=Rickettsiales endosymbiont of Trichoplax sp. H2 TaxID=2021221 RepID=UPI0012B22463|nr:nucleoside triphosphate pyrophosphatase [Rickettsiales endosymbiont of Trichoplax sp. H2]MSO14235.1 Maf-like protein [Rickettsiales endosymbiont of Trichoplax sp. H2]
MYKFILASSSPRRISLLNNIGYNPDKIISADIDETPNKKELPKEYAKRMAFEKASKIHKQFSESLILGADTVVSRGRSILTKPKDKDDAHRIFKLLSGRRHSVFTGICIIKENKVITKVVETKLKFKLLTNMEIQNLIDSNEWQDKSGGYALQGFASAYISWINGHPSNVIGLPVHEAYKILNGLGLKQNTV